MLLRVVISLALPAALLLRAVVIIPVSRGAFCSGSGVGIDEPFCEAGVPGVGVGALSSSGLLSINGREYTSPNLSPQIITTPSIEASSSTVICAFFSISRRAQRRFGICLEYHNQHSLCNITLPDAEKLSVHTFHSAAAILPCSPPRPAPYLVLKHQILSQFYPHSSPRLNACQCWFPPYL